MTEPLSGREIILYARSIAPSLSNKEKLIADFIGNNYSQIPELSINNIADNLEVSNASITKVCKKIKCSGFFELKKKIKEYLEDSSLPSWDSTVENEFKFGDDNSTITQKVFAHVIIALQDTLEGLDKNVINSVSNILINLPTDNKIFLFGQGGSGILCSDFQHKLLKIGITAVFHQDDNMQLMSASLAKKGDVAIGISHSGTTKDVIQCLGLVRFYGGTSICITNHAISPAADISNYTLHSSARNSPLIGENAAARVSQLTIMDVLYSILVVQHGGIFLKNLERTRSSVDSHRTNNGGKKC
ncbi:SIS domain-containing protein [Oenococcus sp. UCMA 17063]|nr:SIS domain-containing protein [Oenococcus sp. UCMA 17063]